MPAEKHLNFTDCSIHTSVKPLLHSKKFTALTDSIRKNNSGNSLLSFSKSGNSRNRIRVAGIFDSELGLEQSSYSAKNLLLDGGISVEGNTDEKFAFGGTFIASNSSFPSYIDSFISKTHVIPGMGPGYTSQNGYSSQYYAGYISYSPNRIFNFQIGKDKHFWGDGYRSLFLSDVSNSIPFLKISTSIWKIQYTSLFTCLKDATAPSHLKKDFLNKYGSFHCLSWNIAKRINIGLFESVVWQGTDPNRVRNFDINYLNPVIFFRPVEYSLGSSDNALIGLSFKIKAAKTQQFYGQVILDEFLLSEVRAMNGWWGNKQGIQLGFKSFDLFTLKNLTFQTEINAVRPYTYAHGSVQQNYANFNQPLAHPLGANFAESVTFLNYSCKKWMFETEFLFARYGKDENGKNYGQNIFESYTTRPHDYGNTFLQGLKTDLVYTKFKLAYYLIPSVNLMAEGGVILREEKNPVSFLNSTIIFIGIKTALLNRYSDF